jgi:hypothetical protein
MLSSWPWRVFLVKVTSCTPPIQSSSSPESVVREDRQEAGLDGVPEYLSGRFNCWAAGLW